MGRQLAIKRQLNTIENKWIVSEIVCEIFTDEKKFYYVLKLRWGCEEKS